MYSNNSLGATGRSLCREDIEHVSSFDYKSFEYPYSDTGKYGGKGEYNQTNMDFPSIFKDELMVTVDGKAGTMYDLNEQNEPYITGTGTGNSIIAPQTNYNYLINSSYFTEHPIYVELFRYEPKSETNLSIYLLATRCINLGGDNIGFYFCNLANGRINGSTLYINGGIEATLKRAIRPVVEIDLSKVNVGFTGTGTENDAYSLTLK